MDFFFIFPAFQTLQNAGAFAARKGPDIADELPIDLFKTSGSDFSSFFSCKVAFYDSEETHETGNIHKDDCIRPWNSEVEGGLVVAVHNPLIFFQESLYFLFPLVVLRAYPAGAPVVFIQVDNRKMENVVEFFCESGFSGAGGANNKNAFHPFSIRILVGPLQFLGALCRDIEMSRYRDVGISRCRDIENLY